MSNTKDGVQQDKGRGGSKESDAGGNGTHRGGRPPAKAAVTLDREAVLRATAAVLDERGYEGTTIRTISRHLGCAVGSIYRHFTDKNQLLGEVVQGRFTPIAAAAEEGHPPVATTRAFIASAAGRPEQYRLMFWLAALGRGPDEPAAVPSVMRRLVAAWSRHDQLGSLEAAQAHWCRLQGELMLGCHDGLGRDAEAALEALEAEPGSAASARVGATSAALSSDAE